MRRNRANSPEGVASPIGENNEISSRRILEKLGIVALGERLRSKMEAGVETMNKSVLSGEMGRENEDSFYFNTESNIFGVFDGAGGESGAARASSLAAEKMGELVEEEEPNTPEDLKNMLLAINMEICNDNTAGITTGVVGRIVGEGAKKLIWAAAGDSRIYLVRKNKLQQLTQDEGLGRMIYNYLGGKDSYVKQSGKVTLRKGDSIIFCSDGVTGDLKDEAIPNDDFRKAVSGADSAQEAAINLIKIAKKKDDRTAIVVNVN